MSVNPGYDFGLTEEVTAQNLVKWLTGGTLTGPIALSGLEAGTGFSLSGMTNEGDIEVNFNDGKTYVKTRWGMAPIMGGGMFTKRVCLYYAGNSAYRQLAFRTPYFKLGPHGRFITNFSITKESLQPGIDPTNSYCYAAWYQESARADTMGPMTIWPSAESYDPNYDRTMLSSSTVIHPLFCVQGLTPMYGTVQTTYTGQRSIAAGASRGISWNSYLGFYDQYSYYCQPFSAATPNFTPSNTGATFLHWGFTRPVVGTASTRGDFAMNLRI
jgi:hypothetical protein